MEWPVIPAAPTGNIIVPLVIADFSAGRTSAHMTFDANLRRQYYKNADIAFRVSEPACLRMVHMPVYAALKKIQGHWKEVYDQDDRFQQVGQVPSSPSWSTSRDDPRRLIAASIPAVIELEFYDFLKAVVERFLESHDVVLEIFGKSFVHSGYPKTEHGVQIYGDVDFEITHFEAIYIVPKGGPTGVRFLS